MFHFHFRFNHLLLSQRCFLCFNSEVREVRLEIQRLIFDLLTLALTLSCRLGKVKMFLLVFYLKEFNLLTSSLIEILSNAHFQQQGCHLQLVHRQQNFTFNHARFLFSKKGSSDYGFFIHTLELYSAFCFQIFLEDSMSYYLQLNQIYSYYWQICCLVVSFLSKYPDHQNCWFLVFWHMQD